MSLAARLLILCFAVLAAFPARAGEDALSLMDAPVSYTANFYVTSAKGTYRGLVWHAPGRERRDFDTQGGGQSVLLRRDTGMAYLMKPSGRWYVGMALEAAAGLAGGLDGMKVTRKRLGNEKVAGMAATRYRVDATAPRGERFSGDAWFTRDGVMVKAAGTVTSRAGRALAVETGLSQVKMGKVDESRFELPAGWLGVDFSGIPAEKLEQAVESMRPMLER